MIAEWPIRAYFLCSQRRGFFRTLDAPPVVNGANIGDTAVRRLCEGTKGRLTYSRFAPERAAPATSPNDSAAFSRTVRKRLEPRLRRLPLSHGATARCAPRRHGSTVRAFTAGGWTCPRQCTHPVRRPTPSRRWSKAQPGMRPAAGVTNWHGGAGNSRDDTGFPPPR